MPDDAEPHETGDASGDASGRPELLHAVDEVEPASNRRFHLWPRTVRVRLTAVAALTFAIAIVPVAFGLVQLVRDDLIGRVEETNQEQLDQLEAAVRRGDIAPPEDSANAFCVQRPGSPFLECEPRAPDSRGVEQTQREIRTAAGNIVLISQESLSQVDDTVESVTTALLFVVPALIALVALVAWYLTGRALRPVEAIRAEAASITGTTIHRRVPEPATDDEIGRLARTMNGMLDRLEGTSTRQRQFVSDASHELRSPLASLRTNLEVALRHPDRTDWPTVARRALDEDERMELMVTDLLALARLDEQEEHQPVASLAEVDLDELVADETVRPHRVPIDASRVSAGRVHGRREQLARVVRNLVDNAERHAATSVAIALHDDGSWVTLTVDDDGPGVPPDDRERIFERFTRLDEGRARDAGGLGLGLAMVRSIVERHDGTVVAEAAPSGGARFRVTLPSAA